MGKKYRVLSPVVLNTATEPGKRLEQMYQPGAEVEMDEKQAEQYVQNGWIVDAAEQPGQSQGQSQSQGQGQPQTPLGRGDIPKPKG